MPPQNVALPATISSSELIEIYRTMYLIRQFDNSLPPLYRSGKIRGTAHAYTGMEAIAAGTCHVLRPDDLIASTHRGHGHCLAKGLEPRRMMEELMGRAQGYCRGKGGSLHLTSLVNGMLGADGVVGGSLALAVGAAYASNLIGRETVVVAYFGDGASNAGLFHEAANLASILSAPVLFVCENNQWALSTRTTEVTAGPGIADRAASYGIPGRSVDGNDVLAVIDAATPLVERARIGQGPSLLEAKTYRMGLHSLYSSTGGDDRDPAELEDWANKDPVDRTRALLLGLGEEPRVAEVEREVDELIARAISDAADSPYPEPSAAYEDVYSLSNVVGPDRLS